MAAKAEIYIPLVFRSFQGFQVQDIKEFQSKRVNCTSVQTAQVVMAEVYEWAFDAKAWNIFNWIQQMREQATFWDYFLYKVTTGVSEGVNRAIKGLKWQAYGYRNMQYFKLKIMQKLGYLNSRYNPMTV